MKPILINLNIGDQLTATSCGHVIVELIKFIVHQRLQIPYTYQWLKQVVNKKKMTENSEKKDTLQSEIHFRLVSSALENLDFILKSLQQEINGPVIPEEICIALGSTPDTCKEMYRLLLPTIFHKFQCHSNNIASDQKIQRCVFKQLTVLADSIFGLVAKYTLMSGLAVMLGTLLIWKEYNIRTLVTSDLSQVIFTPMAPTNMYIFIRKKFTETNCVPISNTFIPASGCRLPKDSKVMVIDFRAEKQDKLSCCNDFPIFNEFVSNGLVNLELGNQSNFCEIESSDTMTWYQSSYVMKGFKDCIVKGSSITNMWLETS